MNSLNLIQQISPAQIIVMIALLPWMVVAMMHALSALPRMDMDDNFSSRADAALRWSGDTPDPVTPPAGELLAYPARPAARVQPEARTEHAYMEDEAA